MLRDNLKVVEDNIQKACDRVNRPRQEVTLVAVSKTKPLSLVENVLDLGILEFGENKVQELLDKHQDIYSPVHWHLIGHLQTNKVKYIVDKVALIHSVDSYKLALQIQKEAIKKEVHVNILIQVNIANEDTKFGVSAAETLELIEQIKGLTNVHVKGLMTSAPFVDNPELNRDHFKHLHDLFVDIKGKNLDNIDMSILSMGMTNDYEVAIEEGSTMVRIGTGIFGTREHK